MPYITRVIGADGVGTNAVTGSFVQYFVLIGSLGFSIYGNREIAKFQNDVKQRSKIFYEIVIVRLITIIISYTFFLIFLYFQKQNITIYLFQSVAIISAGIDISWYFMGMEKFRRTIGRNFLVQILSLISIFVFVKDSGDLIVYIAIIGLSTLIGNLSLWVYIPHELIKISVKKIQLWKHMKPSFTFFLPNIAVQVYVVLNKQMIGSMDSVSHAGWFDMSDKIVKISLSLVLALGTVMLPRMSSIYAEKKFDEAKALLIKSFNLVSSLALPLTFGLMSISLKFSPYFLGKDFSGVGVLIMMESTIIIFIAWSNVLGMQYWFPLNKMRYYTQAVTLGALGNILLNLFLIPFYGVYGAMVATIITEIFVTVFQLIAIRKSFRFSVLMKGQWKYLLSSLVLFFVVFTLNQRMTMNIKNLFIQISVGIIIYVWGNIILKTELYVLLQNLIWKNRKR